MRDCAFIMSFDWIADGTGFDFSAVSAAGRHEMGSRLEFARGLQLQACAPLPVRWRLMLNGEVVTEADGPHFKAPLDQPGCYRIEAWLDVAEEKWIWILSNPVYVRASGEKWLYLVRTVQAKQGAARCRRQGKCHIDLGFCANRH